jgi:hypothetical protein
MNLYLQFTCIQPFENFVREANLELYPIGGDPKELMAYMVKNPGLIPSMKSLREGEIQRKCKMITEVLKGYWNSTVNLDLQLERPFIADAIIAICPVLLISIALKLLECCCTLCSLCCGAAHERFCTHWQI